MRISSDGNVGIGTINPSKTLSVDGTFYVDGNVGINTENPTEALTVNGNIKAERIDIISDVASDVVFDDDYALRPLKVVEDFVRENKHLPEIPSAEELKETGYNVGTMDDLLLRKVEELTLYIIEQNKQIEELKQRIDELE